MTAHTLIRRFSALAALLALTLAAPAQAPATKSFNVPADLATKAIQAFSGQSGVEVLVPTEAVKGVRTHAVTGEMTPRAALEKMMAGTGLTVIQDEKTGALGLRADPAAAKNAEGRVADANAVSPEGAQMRAIKLETYRVLGSRIRRTETDGPSPVDSYDKEYIRSTGAMNVADFLNMLPQTYSGIGAGRGSTPNELNPEFGQRTETTSPAFNFVLGASAAPPGQTGVSGVSLRGLGSGSTLVLIDGRRVAQSGAGNRGTDTRQGFVDLNTIPLGMIERIEVLTDGASAIYGADAIGGVVNVILKRNWVGHELTGTFKGAQHGGGRERATTLTSGFAAGKLSGTVSVNYYDRSDLKASQRRFTKNQDHRAIIAGYDASGNPVMGRDLRVNWGYPATVQAVSGMLAGVTRPDGTPTNVALAPEGFGSMPPLSAFIGRGPVPPNTGVFASGQRRGNTAEFLDLIPESQRYGFGANLTYKFNDRLEFFGDYTFSDSRGKSDTQPPVTSASSFTGFGSFASVVPAARNPFGQDVMVGMVHYEFGPIWQTSKTQSHRGHFGARGSYGDTWQWDSALGYDSQKGRQLTRDFNGAAITAALASGALNPFIDARVAGSTQATVYETMAMYPFVNSSSELISWDFQSDGTVAEFWGGPIQMAWGGSYNHTKVDGDSVRYNAAVTLTPITSAVAAKGDNYAAFSELSVPVFGKANARPGLQRLDIQIAGRYEDYSTAKPVTLPKLGASWQPVKSLLFRTSYSEGFRPPGLTEHLVPTSSFTSTVTDPRRTPASTPGVTVTSGSRSQMDPETSETIFHGLVYEPSFLPGLNLSVNYYDTKQQDVLQQLSANTMLLNESLFADRITRAAPDATDTSLNQPGRVLTVDRTFVSFGRVRNRSMDYQLDYTLPWKDAGRWRVSFTATHTLESLRQLAPNQPPIIQDDDTYAPPAWKYNASVFWSQGPWNASLFYYRLSGFKSNSAGNTLTATYPVAGVEKFDVRGGYEFKNGVWRGYAKGLRILGGIGNVFDQEPPFSDTVYGYNGGLHSQWVLGRSYELSFVLPF